MGMGNPEPIYYSADMVRDLIDETRPSPRYETVHGELLVTPSPGAPHQFAVTRLAHRLATYLEREPIGEVLVAPADISWGLSDVLVQPDVFVVPIDAARGAWTDGWSAIGDLLLAVEVLSPSSRRQDRFTKRRLYQERGTPLYWLVDPGSAAVEVWTPADDFPRVERERLVWHAAGAATPFELALDGLR